MSDETQEDQNNNSPNADKSYLQTEYSALSSYFNTVVTFRFTTLGFFLAALALIVASEVTRGKAILLMVITIALWLIELRNRTLYDNLGERGMQIERTYWEYKGKHAYEPFFSHMFKKKPVDDKNAEEPPPLDHPKWLNGRIEIPFAPSHGLGLDLLYFAVVVYAYISFLTA
jgi:hypothetical protein